MDVWAPCISMCYIVPGVNQDQKRAPHSQETSGADVYEEQGEDLELNLDPLEDDQYS